MRKLLAATTALALVGGAAAAELTMGADARFNVKYDSEEADSIAIHQRFRVTFDASGTTDGGLAFSGGAVANSDGGSVGDGYVSISGAFGTLTFGAKDSADVLAGDLADVGIQGVGVDDVAEGGLRGHTDPGDLVLYEQSLGNINFAMSGSTSTGGDDDDPDNDKDDAFAIGVNFTASGITIGMGYDSEETMSLGGSYTINEITVNAYYAERDAMDGVGVDLQYAMGGTTLTVVAAQNSQDEEAMGLGLSHDLGGGAKMVAGFGQIPDGNGGDANGAEVGLTFSF